jgi:hypothetical protein
VRRQTLVKEVHQAFALDTTGLDEVLVAQQTEHLAGDGRAARRACG